MDESKELFSYVKEIAMFRYRMEQERENSIINQSVAMQAAFSFIIGAVLMALPIVLEYSDSTVPKSLIFIVFSSVILLLILSLGATLFVQWRYKRVAFENIDILVEYILRNSDFLADPNKQIMQLVKTLGASQDSLSKINDKRASWLKVTIFLCGVALLVIIIFSLILFGIINLKIVGESLCQRIIPQMILLPLQIK